MTDNLAKIDPPRKTLPADPMLSMIERVVMDPDLPIDRVQAMFDLRERQMAKEAEQAFNTAFARAMAEMPVVPKNGRNNHTGNRYSTLADLINTARPVLSRHGLSLNWSKLWLDDGNLEVTAHVRHSLGHQITTSDRGARDQGKQMNNLQGGGSTETYLKRYTGFSILGLSSGDEVDDDGTTAALSKAITADQARALRDLIAETDSDEAKLCAFFNVERLDDLPGKAYPRADQMLRAKKKDAAQ